VLLVYYPSRSSYRTPVIISPDTVSRDIPGRDTSVSIQPLESASQVPVRVPRLQAKPRSRSLVFNHFISTLLDDYYISKRTKKRTQDRQHKCKQCQYNTLNSRRDGTANMIEHLKKHNIYLTPSMLSQQPTIDAMFRRPIEAQTPVIVMSLEQAILE
jgi:hypothetical protein